MENQHKHIKGYRELTADEIALMNEIKAMGEQLEALCDKVKAHLIQQRDEATKDDPEEIAGCPERDRIDRADPHHWESWGRSSAQATLMYLTRAVAQPTTF